jgi:hypothetical protein
LSEASNNWTNGRSSKQQQVTSKLNVNEVHNFA